MCFITSPSFVLDWIITKQDIVVPFADKNTLLNQRKFNEVAKCQVKRVSYYQGVKQIII